VDKVPLLGDIPILGYLFKYTRKTSTKQNLLIILTPYVIKDPADLRRIFERKVLERREFLERYSSFSDDSNFEANVDYRHKRGLLEEINRTAIDAEREASDIRAAEAAARARILEGPIDVPSPPSSRSGRESNDGASAGGASTISPVRLPSPEPPPAPVFIAPVPGEAPAPEQQ
jgi:general secretion pathway protein D